MKKKVLVAGGQRSSSQWYPGSRMVIALAAVGSFVTLVMLFQNQSMQLGGPVPLSGPKLKTRKTIVNDENILVLSHENDDKIVVEVSTENPQAQADFDLLTGTLSKGLDTGGRYGESEIHRESNDAPSSEAEIDTSELYTRWQSSRETGQEDPKPQAQQPSQHDEEQTTSLTYRELVERGGEEALAIRQYREAKLDSYLSLRTQQCDNDKKWVNLDMAKSGLLNSYLYGEHTAVGPSEERYLSMITCDIEEEGGESGWQVYRLGPFVGSGGWDTHQVYVHPLPKPSKAKFITGKLTAPVTMDGEVIGYPPIYSHHVHTKVNGVEHVLEAHGDTTCAEEYGGLACYLHSYPEGYGMPFNSSIEANYLSLDFLLVDKREYPAPPMIFFEEIAVKWTSAVDMKPISSAMFHAKNSKGHPYATTMVAQRPSIMWSTGEWFVDGKVLISPEDQLPWFHAHRPYFKSMWAFAASPEELGLTADLLRTVDDYDPDMIEVKDYDYVWTPDGEDATQALMDRISSSSAGMDALRCWLIGSEEEKILEHVNGTDSSALYPESWHQNWKESWYDRAGEVHCDPWSFKKGDSYTVVTLNGIYEPMKEENISTLQHNGFWLVYESTGEQFGPNLELYGPYTSNETLTYKLPSTWMPNELEGMTFVNETERVAAIAKVYESILDRNFWLSTTTSTEMFERFYTNYKHAYFDSAIDELYSIIS